MKLYLTDKLKQINIIQITDLLLRDYIESNKSNYEYMDIDSLNSVTAFTDDVKEFLDMYFSDFPIELDNNAKVYVLNRLYAVKGGLQVFNVLNDLLSINIPEEEQYNIELGINYDYQFPHLNILDIESVGTSDVSEFERRLRNMLNVLLFYDELKLIIKNIRQLINDTLKDTDIITIKPYYVHNNIVIDND